MMQVKGAETCAANLEDDRLARVRDFQVRGRR